MNNPEASLTILRDDDGQASISVFMPIWSKPSEYGKLNISLPLLGLETIAKDESEADQAIGEAIALFCILSEKYGQGVEKELQTLGWERIDGETGEPVLGYCVSNPNSVLERLMKTGDSYMNEHLQLEMA